MATPYLELATNYAESHTDYGHPYANDQTCTAYRSTED